MTLQEQMDQLAEELELSEKLTPAGEGVFLLPLDEDKEITISSLEPGFYLYSPLLSLPERGNEELLTMLMVNNLFGKGTDGAVIGLDENGELLTLSLAFNRDYDYKEFRDELENFINMLDFWHSEVENYENSSEKGAFFE